MATTAEQTALQVRTPAGGGGPMLRQLGVMVALAVSVALGVAVVLWSQTPNYSLLYSSLGDREMSAVVEGLEQLGVDYKLDAGSHAVMVPSSRVDELRLKLAGLGLPRGGGQGFELLEQDTGFGTSHAIERVRIQRALEGEIARSIMTIQSVRAARVLLALPKQSVFLRNSKKPSASVVVNLHAGRTLTPREVDAIVHLVASGVPQLDASQVTVVDQKGTLLNSKQEDDPLSMTGKQFEYKQGLENHLMHRVENILLPMVGQEGMRAQVSADVDFTLSEQTQESFNPDLPAIRSEQVSEEQSSLAGAQGIPGALSNQPPAAGVAPEVAADAAAPEGSNGATNVNKRQIRNYELDKTISHTRLASGRVKRLTVAVVVDNKRVPGEEASVPYTDEELQKFTTLVKEAVGFDATRGDRVTVTNAPFKLPEVPPPPPELAIWEQPWFWDVAKQVLGGIFVIVLFFGILRPTIKSLLAREKEAAQVSASREMTSTGGQGGMASGGGGTGGGMSNEMGEDEELKRLEAPKSYEQRLEMAKKMAGDDPKRVAQVMKTWVTENG